MAQNTAPIFALVPNIGFNSYMTAANTTADLTSGTIYLVFTADATEGSYLQSLLFKPTPGGNTTTTVARVWLNNGATTGTATNNILLDDIDLPSVTASASAAVTSIMRRYDLRLPAGWRVYITLGTASANGWACTAVGGDY